MDERAVAGVTGLTARWAARVAGAESTVLSGLGAWPLVAILATAADEPGRSELAEAAGVDAGTGAALAAGLMDLLDKAEDLKAALGVWVAEDLKLAESFGEVMPAPLRGVLTGDTDRDKAMLDAWVSEHTDGLIREMPLRTGPDLVLALASALSLRTTWVKPFAEHQRVLNDGPWAGRTVPWLTRTDAELAQVGRYGDLVTATVAGAGDVDVRLGLGTPEARAATVIPALLDSLNTKGTDGAALLAEAEPGQELMPGLAVGTTAARRPDVQLSLPAYEIRAEHDLLEQADLFGLTAVSKPDRGHFSRISPEPLAVSQARQSVYARFFATGFEAAAVTAVGMTRAAMITPQTKQLRLTLDRPFGFVAVHRPTGLPIVTGWLATPESAAG